MIKRSEMLMKDMPWLLIVFGFLILNMFHGYVALSCMLIGIVMLVERVWPEKWESDKRRSDILEL